MTHIEPGQLKTPYAISLTVRISFVPHREWTLFESGDALGLFLLPLPLPERLTNSTLYWNNLFLTLVEVRNCLGNEPQLACCKASSHFQVVSAAKILQVKSFQEVWR